MEYGMEDFWYGMEMEWKKIASMEYGKIVFHSIPCPAPNAQQKSAPLTSEVVSKRGHLTVVLNPLSKQL